MYNRNRNILETIKKITGMKYTEIARYIGVSPGAVQNWKEGRTRPSEENNVLLKELYHNALIKRDINDKKQPEPNEYTKMITTISNAFDMNREDIAEYVGVSENAVTTWSVGPTIPKEHNKHKLKELHEKALSALDREGKEAEIKEDQAAEEPERGEKVKLNNSLLKDGINSFKNLTTNKVIVQLGLTEQEYLALRNESRSSPLPFEQYAKEKLLVERGFLGRIFDALRGVRRKITHWLYR